MDHQSASGPWRHAPRKARTTNIPARYYIAAAVVAVMVLLAGAAVPLSPAELPNGAGFEICTTKGC